MKTLHIINSLSTGGAEKLIVDSVPLYQERGIETDVLLLKKQDTPLKDILAKNTKGNIFEISEGSLYNPKLIFKIIPYLKKYDIIHLHLFPTLYWVVFAKITSFSKIKLIYTEHSTNNRRRDKRIFKIIDRFVYKRLNKIGSITDGVKKELQKHIGPDKEIVVINNGIIIDDFKLNTKKQFDFFDKEDFILIQVSSFREQKDQATIIRSLKYLPDNVKLLLVGDGPLIDENKQLADDLSVDDRVIFLGNRYDVPDLVNYADVSILSSHWEGFGLAIIEGMAARKPSVASNVDGIREIVKGYGILFEQGNEKELADKILKLLNDKDYYNEVADKCYERAQQFDINRMVDSYIELYKEVLAIQ